MKHQAVLALLLLAAGPARADDAMTAAANAFYSLSVGQHLVPGGGIPNATARARLTPLLSARLNASLANAAAAEARFTQKNKDAPPLMEGDLFSSLFEGATAWKVGACRGDGANARCAVALSRQDPGHAPVSWIDTLVLVDSGGWKVDDIAYDANFAFGNTGTLSQMLRMTEAEAP